MFILTEEIKGKLIRDLSRDIRLRNYTFAFKDSALHCISKTDGTPIINCKDIPHRYSYTALLKFVKSHLYELMSFYNSTRSDLKKIGYEDFVKEIRVYKREKEPIDCLLFCKKDDIYYQFTVEVYCHIIGKATRVLITQDVLDAHGVDVETFFIDVIDEYTKDGINILDNSVYESNGKYYKRF